MDVKTETPEEAAELDKLPEFDAEKSDAKTWFILGFVARSLDSDTRAIELFEQQWSDYTKG